MREKSYKQISNFLKPTPFRDGEVVYLKGSFSYNFIYHFLAKKLANKEREAILMDGANVFDPYKLVGEAKEMNQLSILDQVKICRGFTAYQYFDIIYKRTKKVFNKKTKFISALEPSNLLLDKEIKLHNEKKLFKKFLEGMNSFFDEQVNLIVVDNNKRYNKILNSFSDQKIIFKEVKEGIKVNWGSQFFYFDPSISPYQTTLNRFIKELGGLKEPISFEKPQKKIKEFIEV